MRALILTVSLLVAASPSGGEAESITAAALESHAQFLASDEMRGRDTGSVEAMLAAGYLAVTLERAGLEGAGDDGGFLQAVPLFELVALGTPQVDTRPRGGEGLDVFAHGEHFSIYRNPASQSGELKLVRVPAGGPLPDPDASIALDFEGSRRDAKQLLSEAGAEDGSGYGLIVLRGSSKDGKPRQSVRTGGLSRGSAEPNAAPAWIVARGELKQALESGRLTAIAYDGACELAPVEAANVLARIPGVGTPERPELAQEVVVISAHYDHIGVIPADRSAPLGADGEPDRIYNGADDDVSGVACVLEVARALAAGPAPAREVVILLATGEEKGLLGTEHYLDFPASPLERTIANLNVEMIGRADANVGGAGQVWFTGPDETNLLSAFNAAGVSVSRDPYPDQNYYKRSDNYAFVKRGVIGQTFSTYDGHADYHQVTDEPDTLDYEHMAGATRITLDAIRLVTSGAITPTWAAGKGPPEPR
jgi:peptidase M28-like protein